MLIELSFYQTLRWATIALWAAFFLVYWQGGWAAIRDFKASATRDRTFGGLAIELFILVWTIGLVAGATSISLGRAEQSNGAGIPWLALIGTAVTALGFALAFLCRFGFLGRYWSGKVGVQEHHQIIDRGPYRWVRHPIYACMPLFFLGTGAVFTSWFCWLCCVGGIVGYAALAAYEDRFLAANLPGYQEYQQRVPYRMVPLVW